MTQPMRVGGLRPNQLLHTYGVGAVADLPNLSVVVAGLDDWELAKTEVVAEERLLAAIRAELGHQVGALRTPPYTPETGDPFAEWTRVGVPVRLFPRWLRCSNTSCNRLAPVESGMFELLGHSYSPERIRYIHGCRGRGGSRPTVVPARFVLACEHGHLDDFPWMYYVHRGEAPPGEHTLRLTERGTTGEAANVYVECSCGSNIRRSMAEAFGREAWRTLPACRGHNPHLATFAECGVPTRTMGLGATNGWFAMKLSAFTLPLAEDELTQKIAHYWKQLSVIAELPDELARRILPEQTCWKNLDTDDVDAVLRTIHAHAEKGDDDAPTGDELDLDAPEWEALTRPGTVELPDFTIRKEPVPATARPWLHEVVLASRLRRVSALYGFTRIDAPEWNVQATDKGRAVPLAREAPAWVPCAETRGEGILLRFKEDQIAAWEQRDDVLARQRVLRVAHDTWRAQRQLAPGHWPGIRYVLLHTFAHALIRELALECGYSASGIAERIYARTGEHPMAGVLLYTAAPDSEGTLGGLVSLGDRDRLAPLLGQALDVARLCSSDPLCAQHDPRQHGRLYGAACHACLFAAETSCERGNHYLDRTLLTDTVTSPEIGFLSRRSR